MSEQCYACNGLRSVLEVILDSTDSGRETALTPEECEARLFEVAALAKGALIATTPVKP